ncbi:hypothetical protein [uncultured Pantoea sp.]|uniref:hypothetical protein n=1 Tax=uncultured Pantoea sp. TaxID=218084 RepID=UPI00258F48A4|nr:hypothetical protein [uncultured Pantoea sp.]
MAEMTGKLLCANYLADSEHGAENYYIEYLIAANCYKNASQDRLPQRESDLNREGLEKMIFKA